MGLKTTFVATMLFALSAGLFALSAGSVGAEAAEKQPPLEDDRYSVSKLENGYLRLDKKTGDLAHCVIDGHDAWKCVILPETRAKQRQEIDALTKENTYLKARQKAMETRLVELEETLFELRDRLGEDENGDAKRKPGDPTPLVSKEERKRLNEALDAADAMVRRFGDLMRGLKEDAENLGSKIPKILD